MPLAGIEPALAALEAAALPSDSRGVEVMATGPGAGVHPVTRTSPSAGKLGPQRVALGGQLNQL